MDWRNWARAREQLFFMPVVRKDFGEWFLFTMDSNNDEMNGQVFEDWLASILPKLDENAVIVLDNAPYHCRQINKIPKSRWNKLQTVAQLSEGVQADVSYLKAELLDMVLNLHCKPKYVVEMVKATGRMVLKTPPYLCILNPIELVWSHVNFQIGWHEAVITWWISWINTTSMEGCRWTRYQ